MSNNISGQTLTQTYAVDTDIIGDPLLGSVQPDFPLCEADFIWLTQEGSKFRELAISTFFLSIGYAISIAAKYIAHKTGTSSTSVEAWEPFALLIGALLFVVLFFLSKIYPSNKQRLLKEIKEHFANNPRQRHIMRRENNEQ